jgi:hypothetical protein
MTDDVRILKTVVHPATRTPVRGQAHRWLGVDWQGDDLVVWFEGLPGSWQTHELMAYPTGATPPAGRYIGSAQRTEPDGSFLVMHVYAFETPA